MNGRGILIRTGLIVLLAAGLWSLPSRQHLTLPSVSQTVAALPNAAAAPTETSLVAALPSHPLRGASVAKGVIIWSHGRSLTREDSASSAPLYLAAFADAGWDVMRFNRPRLLDRLANSTADLVARVRRLRADGYTRIVVAGQSYGAFIALGAAKANPDIDAVIATAPAAYGNFFDSYETWQSNEAALAPLLRGIGHTPVALAFFHGDDYDPGGRGAEAKQILTEQGTPFLLIDQPRDLVGHLAANTGLFVRRYAGCLVAFAEKTDGTPRCDDDWGLRPSVALLDEAAERQAQDQHQEDTGASTAADADSGVDGRWYGYYPNGREFLMNITGRHGDQVEAIYGVGPSVDGKTDAAWIARKGAVVQGSVVFSEPGRSHITLTPTDLGTMNVLWQSIDGTAELEATARRIR